MTTSSSRRMLATVLSVTASPKPFRPTGRNHLRDWQTPPANAVTIDNQNALRDVGVAEGSEDFAHPEDHVSFAPITAAEKDHTRLHCSRKREQPRVIQIGRDYCPAILNGSCEDLRIRGSLETQREGVNR